MRKRLITPSPQAGTLHDEGWLDLDREAVVELTSEEKEYPVEAALVAGETRGWRAADSGAQTVRLIFDKPQRIECIALVFEEIETERTQEFVLRWSRGWRTLVSRNCAPAVEFQSP
jgi:XRCC1 N terminal domain